MSRRARTSTSPARLGRMAPVTGSRTASPPRATPARKAARPEASASRRSSPLAFGGAGKRSATTEGSSESPGGRRDRLVGRLVGLLRGLDELGEDPVHEAQDGGAGAEVLHEVQHGAARRGLRPARELAEEAHLGAAEAVDRLLGVAHHHERPGAVAGEEARDLDLERVGVLELVDDQVAEAAAVPLAHARVVAQRVARHQEEVEEVEDAPLGLLPRVERGDAAQGPDEPAVEVRAPGRGPRRAGLLRPRRDRAALGERLRRGPVRLEAEVGLDGLERQQVVDEGVALEEPRGLREVGEPLEAAAEAVAFLHRRRERLGAARPSPAARPAPPRERRRRPPPRGRGRAGRAASARGRAGTCARPTRRPRAGCRSRGRRAARRPRPPAGRRATPPTPRRRSRPPAPRRPCGSRGGPRTRAAAPAGPGRTARGWSRRSPARAPRGRRPRGRARRPASARRRGRARAARAGAASWWWPRSR